ncbi:MAG TPA: tRNA preQ1(34) S-adenosylmethionine ribosyltransferase-isomerase QueA [Candidatus Dormibacteraeota bacterium]|nr:tRNA preQ1(34) S-adenosylmethionine ribosyltransferase-isomerase QueA [Candidatus Dormibacteraeota bacterium]
MTAGSESSETSLELYDYFLPHAAVAQQPRVDRDGSRMLVLEGASAVSHQVVRDLPWLLRDGDCLVVNDTRVRAARLRGQVDGREVEILLVREVGAQIFAALVRPGRLLRLGRHVRGQGWEAEVVGLWDEHPGGRVVSVRTEAGIALDSVGEVPLPPYIQSKIADPSRYQTIFAKGPPVSAAAPTAGLHLTEELLARIAARGVKICAISLEVGLATFSPIRTENIQDHQMHKERYSVPRAAVMTIQGVRQAGGRVVAVGTTVARCLESALDRSGAVTAGTGETDLYLRPGVSFRVVDGLLTNFHQPRSSLMVLVSAFFGGEEARGAYRQALDNGYRFLSFGDCMFGWRR